MQRLNFTDQNYNSKKMKAQIGMLKRIYPFLETGEIGKSVLNDAIPYLRIGKGDKEVFYSAAIHANEWITSMLLMKFVNDFCFAYANNRTIYGYSAREIFKNTSIYVVPMCNPDGVNLVTGEFKEDALAYKQAKKIADRYPKINFPSGWKANIRGVDLNLQFPAGWMQARKIKFSQGFMFPAPRDYVGRGALTEPEAMALYNFTLQHNFRLVLTYHTQGKEIYWQYLDNAPKEGWDIGEKFEKVSGYKLADVPYMSSFAGYKDWFLQEYKRPGYTVEAGIGENPLPISQFNEMYSNNIGIFVLGAIV